MTAPPDHLLSVVLCMPLGGALALSFVDRGRITAIRGLAMAFTGATFAASVPLWFFYDPHGKTWQFAERGPGIDLIGASYYLGADGYSVLLILLVSLVCLSVSWLPLSGGGTMTPSDDKPFFVLLLLLEAGALGALMSLDLLLFLLCSEVLVVGATYLLIRRSEDRARPAARSYLTFMLASSVALTSGVLGLWFHTRTALGAPTFDVTVLHTLAIPPSVQALVFLAFLIGFAIKVPLVPFQSWLLRVHTGSAPRVSALVAAASVELGVFGFMRFSLPILPDASRESARFVGALALVSIAWAGLMVVRERERGRLLAWVSVSQLALAVFGIFLLSPAALSGGILQQVSCGIALGGLFLVAGPVPGRPVLVAILALAAIGVPPLSGFPGARLIMRSAWPVYGWWMAAALIGLLWIGWCVLRFLGGRMPLAAHTAPAAGRSAAVRRLVPVLPLAAVAFVLGVHPVPLLSRTETAVGRAAARVDPSLAPYVARGSDCATPAPPDPGGPPPAFVLVEPCTDGATSAPDPPAPNRVR